MNGTSKLLQPYSITHSLVPSVDRVDHDHNYCHKSDSGSSHVKLPIDSDQPKQNDMDVRITTAKKISEVKSSLSVTNTIRCNIESKTRQQSATKEWHYARVRQITSSICGQILTQKKRRQLPFYVGLFILSLLIHFLLQWHGVNKMSKWLAITTEDIHV